MGREMGKESGSCTAEAYVEPVFALESSTASVLAAAFGQIR